ncbi:MAG: intradiol ring-cleavage dioxygenase [Gemmatimonadaceae bacterium]|nr:intradiol ring-cleavage dioxygenase [Gemmatimonadaceae bacterium]
MRRLIALLMFATSCNGSAQQRAADTRLPDCEACGAAEAPAGLTATMTIAPPEEPGERLIIRGTVYQPDGRRPAAGVLMYAYHTNAAGAYARRGGERGNAQRHGYLRGWLLTDSLGRYTIHTIRPAAYPSATEPQHVHVTLTPPGGRERWVESTLFADDPLLPERLPRGHPADAIVRVERQAGDTLLARRDFVLDASGRREIGDFVLKAEARDNRDPR